MSAATMSISVSQAADDGAMNPSGPSADRPERRRRFTPAQKLEYLSGYEQGKGQGGAFLRREDLCVAVRTILMRGFAYPCFPTVARSRSEVLGAGND